MANNRLHVPARRSFLLGVCALACAPALTGCGDLIGPTEAPQLYVLHPAKPAAQPGPKVAWALAINGPDASDSLDTNRIALQRSDTTMDYYAKASWPDRMPALVQTALLSAFENSGRIDAVARASDALHADYALSTDIRDFTARYDTPDGAPKVTVTLNAHMALTHGRKMVASFSTTQTVPATANSVDAVVQAFDSALGTAVAAVTAWALALPPPPSTGPALPESP